MALTTAQSHSVLNPAHHTNKKKTMAGLGVSGKEYGVAKTAPHSSGIRFPFLGRHRVVFSGRRAGVSGKGAWRNERRCRAAVGIEEKILGKGKKLVDGRVVLKEGGELGTLFFRDNAPTWEELGELVEERRVVLGVEETDLETGPPDPRAVRRTFESTEPIRVKLYRDTLAWCPFCQQIWIQLEEKKIPYEVEKINFRGYGDKPASYLEMVPDGGMPAMELDGELITESANITEALENKFPESSLLQDGISYKEHKDLRQKLIGPCTAVWLPWCSSSKEEEEKHKASFVAALQLVENELGATAGPYFLKEFSLVDILCLPAMERMNATMAYYKGFRMRGEGQFPNIERWFEAMEARPTYIATKGDYYTLVHGSPRILGGFKMNNSGKLLAHKIDGDEWRLPLEPLSANSFEPYTPGDNPPLDTYRAAQRLVENHEAIVKFACRGCGEDEQPVKAPLANPNATPNYDYLPQVDAGMRHVAHALLVGVEEKQSSESGSLSVMEGGGSGYAEGGPCYVALDYVRNRVSVPNDLQLPPARQLRAHLTWMMESIVA